MMKSTEHMGVNMQEFLFIGDMAQYIPMNRKHAQIYYENIPVRVQYCCSVNNDQQLRECL